MTTPAENLRFKVKTHAPGRSTVYWECPKCRVELHAPLADAGNADTCPQCGTTFTVPGITSKLAEERRRLADEVETRRKQAAAAEQVRQRNIAAQRAVMAAKAENKRSARTVPFTAGLPTMGVLAFVVGILLIFAGIVTDATVPTGGFGERVYNTGLLAAKTSLLTCGTMTSLAGFLMLGLGKLGAEVNRWGDSVLRRLELDAAARLPDTSANDEERAPNGIPDPDLEVG